MSPIIQLGHAGGVRLPQKYRSAVFYLDPAGSDAASGRAPGSAWQTWEKAAERVWEPGDRLFAAPGTYTASALVEFRGGGDPLSPVVITASDTGNKPLINFGTSRTNSVKFNVCGDGFLVDGIKVTQTGFNPNTPSDRQMAAQLGQDGVSQPRDVTFYRCESYNSYETFKASGAVQRIHFVGCLSYNSQIGVGITGAADDCSIIGSTVRDFTNDGIQTKGGCRNPLIRGNTVVLKTGSDTGISLGGSSAIYDGTNPAWWRDDGYESTHALSCSNLVVLSSGDGSDFPAAILFAGAKSARSTNDTIIQLDAFTLGYATAFQVSRSSGANWTGGAPYSGDVIIENAIVVGVDQLITCNTGNLPTGSNTIRNLTLQGVYDNLTDDGYNVGTKGTWTLGTRNVRNPLLVSANLAGPWTALDDNLQAGSPERGVGTPVTHLNFSGVPMVANLDRTGRTRGATNWHRGAQETP